MVTLFKHCFYIQKSFFKAVKLTTNVDPNRFCYSGYVIVFNSHSHFLISNFDFSKTVTIFGVDSNSSAYANISKKIFSS